MEINASEIKKKNWVSKWKGHLFSRQVWDWNKTITRTIIIAIIIFFIKYTFIKLYYVLGTALSIFYILY